MHNLFNGVEKLYGKNAFHKIHNAHIAVVGLGGVGSWALEALARSGVNQLTIVDMDDVCSSNINRQIVATHSVIGQMKTQVMNNRLIDINPQIKVNIVEDFFDVTTMEAFFLHKFDCVIDCIDSVSNKALLIAGCVERSIPIITVGGTSGKKDLTKIQIKDLNRSYNDMLLMRVRKKLKREFAFTRDKKENYQVVCIFSPEEVLETEIINVIDEAPKTIRRFSCQNGPGTSTMYTGTFGFYAASEAINTVITQNNSTC